MTIFSRSRANITSGRGLFGWSHWLHRMVTWCDASHGRIPMRCSNDCSTGPNGCCMVIHGHPSSPDTKVVTGIPGYRAACLVDDVPWMPEAISKSQLKAIKVKQPQRRRKQSWFAFPSPRYRLYDVLASSNWGMIWRSDATSFGISACLVVALQGIRFDFAMWRFHKLPALFGTSIIHCLLQVRFIAKPAPLQARDVAFLT